jgi:hypothetical protein
VFTLRRTFTVFGVALLVAVISALFVHRDNVPHGIEKLSLTQKNESSRNWAGYEVQGTKSVAFQSVHADIVVPRIICHKGPDTFASVWAGLGGQAKPYSMPQEGVELACVAGRPKYWAWYEWYDGSSKEHAQFVHNFPVKVGDSISMLITKRSVERENFSLIESNPKTGLSVGHFRKIVTDPLGTPVGKSAECVVETPILNNSDFADSPLTIFNELTFSNCYVSEQFIHAQATVDVATGTEYTRDSKAHQWITRNDKALPTLRFDMIRNRKLLAKVEPPKHVDSLRPWSSFTVDSTSSN